MGSKGGHATCPALEVALGPWRDLCSARVGMLPAAAVIGMFLAVRSRQTGDLVMCPLAVQSAAAEGSAMAEVLSRERRLRDRNTQLLIPGKSFKRVLDFLQHAQVGVTARLPFACYRDELNIELRCRLGVVMLQSRCADPF